MTTNTLELISFNICPFVQRSVIALNEKGVKFNTTYIDLAEPPQWFLEISPMGKVPVLKTNGTAIFESMVIAEYLEEVCSPKLHPEDPIEKARHRSWIEYASDLTMKQFSLFIAENKQDFIKHKASFKQQLELVIKELSETGPFFSGTEFKMIDAVYAPIFMRIELFNQYFDLELYQTGSRLDKWSKALLQKDSVIKSVGSDFESAFVDYFSNSDYYTRELLQEKLIPA